MHKKIIFEFRSQNSTNWTVCTGGFLYIIESRARSRTATQYVIPFSAGSCTVCSRCRRACTAVARQSTLRRRHAGRRRRRGTARRASPRC